LGQGAAVILLVFVKMNVFPKISIYFCLFLCSWRLAQWQVLAE
jgi:hypothetical protein